MQTEDKLRVVIDTNLIISAIIVPGSLPDQLFRAWQKDLYILVISIEILEEIKEVVQREYIREKYHLSTEKIVKLITLLRLSTELIIPISEQELPLHCRDTKDDKLLTLALAGDVDYLITGDDDLLALNGKTELGKLKIVTVRKFMTIL